ncbi:MAG: thioesterase family protein [Thermoproteota archaeon]|nr:thioesterase family protein [Thermoproteota archaeon]
MSSSQTTSFLWEGENVFSTPSMIAQMEETCRLLLKEQFLQDPESDSVGTHVNIRHLAATPVGTEVLLRAKITGVNDQRITFDVQAFDKLDKIGEGIHERFVINIPRFRAKFNEKLKKIRQIESDVQS